MSAWMTLTHRYFRPLLSAKVMRMANSVALNPSGRNITDLKQAVMRVGIAPIRSLAMALTLDQLRHLATHGAVSSTGEPPVGRSIHVAALAYVVARRLSALPADEAMLAGIVLTWAVSICSALPPKHPTCSGTSPRWCWHSTNSTGLPGASCSKPWVCRSPPSMPSPVAARLAAMPPPSRCPVLFLACWLAPPPIL